VWFSLKIQIYFLLLYLITIIALIRVSPWIEKVLNCFRRIFIPWRPAKLLRHSGVGFVHPSDPGLPSVGVLFFGGRERLIPRS
jgi:hypothetical protein